MSSTPPFELEDGSGPIVLENPGGDPENPLGGYIALEGGPILVFGLPPQPLEVFDNLNGSVELFWPPLTPFNPVSVRWNVYQRLVTATPAFVPGGGTPSPSFAFGVSGFGEGAFGVIPATPAYNAFAVSAGAFTYSEGEWELLDVTPSLGPGGGWYVTVGGLQIASYNPSTQVVTPSQTYDFMAQAVVDGIEVQSTQVARVTPGPTSVMLATPMRRPFPFPNTDS